MPVNRTTRSFVLNFFILLLFFSCTQNPLQVDVRVTPEISNLIVPARVYNQSPRKHVISVTVFDPQGVTDISQVSLTITKAGESVPALQRNLVDDGTQGDIIANDGVFAGQIDGSFAGGDVGEFRAVATAIDLSGNQSNTPEATITVVAGVENLPPAIKNVSAPGSVAVDVPSDFIVQVEITDPNGLEDVLLVRSEFFPPSHPTPAKVDTLNDDGLNGDTEAGDGVYTTTFSSAEFREAADYFLRITAEDRAGDVSAPAVAAIRGVFLNPRAPVISNLVAPDTVRVDPNQVVQILMTIDASDPQGLSDIDFVRFRSFLPDGREATDSPFEMADDGNRARSGDLVAGDGTYSIIINLPPGTPPGNFRFVFEAKDKSNLFSNQIEHIITVTQ